MAKARVSDLFKACCLADRAREVLVERSIRGDSAGEMSEDEITYGRALVVCVRLNELLQNCNFEIDIPPESERFVVPIIEKVQLVDALK